MVAQNSRLLLDYSEYIDKNKNNIDFSNFQGIQKVESIFHGPTYDSPLKAWIHVKGNSNDKITGLNHCQEFPGFFIRRYFHNFK